MSNLRRSRGFKVGDRVKGLLGSIGTSTGTITKILTGSRVEVHWDEGTSCAGVTESRSVDQLEAYIVTPLAPPVDRNETDRRCDLSCCEEPVFSWDEHVNLPGSGARGIYLCSEHINFSQKDVNQFVANIRTQEVAGDENPPDEPLEPDGIIKNLYLSLSAFITIFHRIVLHQM